MTTASRRWLGAITPAGKVAAHGAGLGGDGRGARRTCALAIEKALAEQSRTYRVHVPHTAGADVGWLYGHAEIIGTRRAGRGGVRLRGARRAAAQGRVPRAVHRPDRQAPDVA